MNSTELYAAYKTKMQKIADVKYASAVLQWDQETYLPPKGDDLRGQQIATLNEMPWCRHRPWRPLNRGTHKMVREWWKTLNLLHGTLIWVCKDGLKEEKQMHNSEMELAS
jgi:hypothetical protein